MKLERETILVRTFRQQCTMQMCLLIDFLPQCDDFNEKAKIWAEIENLRAKTRPYDHCNVVELSKQIELKTAVINSSVNENTSRAFQPYTFGHQSALGASV